MVTKKNKKEEELNERQKAFAELIGERIRSLRVAQGHNSYEDFAYEHDISRSQFGRYERGVSDMRMSSFLKILDALKIGPEEFFSLGFEEFINRKTS